VIKVEFENNQLRIGVFSVDDEGEEHEATEEQLNQIYAGKAAASHSHTYNSHTQRS
jgi:hypothetical protein